MRLTSALALCAILIRVLLPALHSPDCEAGHAGSAVSAGHGAAASTHSAAQHCSCGSDHASASNPSRDSGREGGDSDTFYRSVHTHGACLACAHEMSTPLGGAANAAATWTGPEPRTSADSEDPEQVFFDLVEKLPRSRAPPAEHDA